MQFSGIGQAMDALVNEARRVEQQGIAECKLAARTLMLNLFENTPVWSGETVRNYAWGAGGLPGGGARAAVGAGAPGPTNSMVMGSEPRRGANEAAALSEMNSVLGLDKLADLFVTNFSPHWDLVDSGAAPSPGKARNPGGVSILAEQSTRNVLKNWK
jgi:hypothetical protein